MISLSHLPAGKVKHIAGYREAPVSIKNIIAFLIRSR
jgi:hypothetical protein